VPLESHHLCDIIATVTFLSTRLIFYQVLNEYKQNNYEDWPNLNPLQVDTQTTFEDLWDNIDQSSNFLLIIFEKKVDSPAVIHSILDLWPNKQQIGVRRASSNSPLVSMLGKEHGGSAKGT